MQTVQCSKVKPCLVHVGVVGQLVNVPVVFLPVLVEEAQWRHQEEEGKAYQHPLFERHADFPPDVHLVPYHHSPCAIVTLVGTHWPLQPQSSFHGPPYFRAIFYKTANFSLGGTNKFSWVQSNFAACKWLFQTDITKFLVRLVKLDFYFITFSRGAPFIAYLILIHDLLE